MNNPLARHFRQPALYLKLTSNGKYWGEGNLNIPVTGELPILPMTARDEILLRTPDALINGSSTVEVIQSCCPDIVNAWAMPSVDVDSLLIAIRIASYGQFMSITAACPHCGEEHDYDIDLQSVLSKRVMPDYETPVQISNSISVKLKPMSYIHVSESGVIKLEEEKMMQALADPNVPDEIRKTEYEKHLKKIIQLNLVSLANCTESITADGEEVTDFEFIKEYYFNTGAAVTKKIQDILEKFYSEMKITAELAKCNNETCQKEFVVNVDFDYSHFFGKGF